MVSQHPANPKVLIAGAGLGGLTMAIILERAGVDYHIYERHHEFKALGSGTVLFSNIMPLFDQLGLLEKLRAVAELSTEFNFYDSDMNLIGGLQAYDHEEMTGYPSLVFTRIDLHKFLLSQVPKEKISLGKKIIAVDQTESTVTIRCLDNESFSGHLLIGSDGAYSGVRKSLYKTLEKEGRLPLADSAKLQVHHMSILGTTDPLDLTKYPEMESKLKGLAAVFVGSSKKSWRYFRGGNNRVAWRVDTHVDPEDYEAIEEFRLSEWDSEIFRPDLEVWRHYKTDLGVSIGDLVDLTPSENISKVMLEAKLFETWHHGRVVLMGDSCHKMLPHAGRGALNAMIDSVILANEIYELADTKIESIEQAFKNYYDERYPHVVQDLAVNARMSVMMAGQTWFDSLMRKFILGYMPKWMSRKNMEKSMLYRPQLSFLPQIESKGTVKALPQKPSKRYEEENGHATMI